MRRAAGLSLIVMTAMIHVAPAQAQSPDDSLRVYAVNVVKTTPFQKPFTGEAVYLGKGAVLTAAHVIGRWGFLKNPRVLVAGQDLPAKIVKEGSLEKIDLTLLSVDEARLPVSLRLRRNPLCKQPPKVGEKAVIVAREQTTRAQVISPRLVRPAARKRFNTLIDKIAGSGSGIFDAERKCLMGIMSRKVQKHAYRSAYGPIAEPAGYAGYFVPAFHIFDFVPAEFRF